MCSEISLRHKACCKDEFAKVANFAKNFAYKFATPCSDNYQHFEIIYSQFRRISSTVDVYIFHDFSHLICKYNYHLKCKSKCYLKYRWIITSITGVNNIITICAVTILHEDIITTSNVCIAINLNIRSTIKVAIFYTIVIC